MMRGIIVLASVIWAVGCGSGGEANNALDEKKIVWYALMVHPYVEEVQKGVIGYERDTGTTVSYTHQTLPTNREL